MTIERLLGARPGAVVGDVMDPDPPTVSPDTHQEHVAWKAVQHGEPGIAVVDDRGRFRGLISPQTLLAVLLEEHDEDMARLGGSLGSASEARSASTERVGRRLLHRLPWLLVGLVGALVAAVIVGGFAEQLEEQVLIAYFVPGVVYIAAAVGMQTETLVIRGMSLGVGIRSVAAREVITGGLLGMILASIAFPLVWAGWGDVEVAAAVALAMFAASAIATCVAMLLPWALHRLGKDPAFGSGPIATVIQDLLTVSIYFLTAAAIASWRRSWAGGRAIGGASREAAFSPADQPGARPRGGIITAPMSCPLPASSHDVRVFEFHMSPVCNSSRPHVTVGNFGTKSMSLRARCRSVSSLTGPPTASAASGITPARQHLTSYRKDFHRPRLGSPTGPSPTTPRSLTLFPQAGPISMANSASSILTARAEW